MIDFDDIVELLRNNKVQVEFTKVNGERRVMLCTLREDILKDAPYAQDGNKVVERSANKTVVRCLDVAKNEWRSFRTDNVISASVQ